MIRVFLFGDFWNRQPLAYTNVRDRLADRIAMVEDPADAQLIVFSHPKDLTLHARKLGALMAAHPHLRAVLLSEEPFWDTCWSADPFSRFQTWTDGPRPFGYAVVNHFTSDIFDTQSIPYFLLTDPRYLAHYRPRFDRNARYSAQDWLEHWRNATWDAAFIAARRDDPRHEPVFAHNDVWGLSVLRSRIARHCRGAAVLRIGKGWGEGKPRAELQDWHSEKLTRIDLNCRYVSAIENTHQKNYVSEKIFDAFAVGGIPLYIAKRKHSVTRYVGEGSWLNLENRLPRDPPAKSQPLNGAAKPSPELAQAYVVTQNHLVELFGNMMLVDAELDGVANRLYDTLYRLTL